MKIERTKNASRNVLFGVIMKVYQIAVPFVMRTALIYFLGMQYLGLNGLFTSVLQVLNLAELGVGSAMVYSMYKPIAEDDHDRICALMKLYRLYYRIIGIVIGCIGLSITPFIDRLVKGDVPPEINIYVLYLMHLATTVLTYWLFAYKNSLLSAHQRNDIKSKVVIIIDTIKYALQMCVLIFLKNYYIYILVALVTQAVDNIVVAIIANRLYPNYKPRGSLAPSEIKQINGRVRDLFTAKFGSVIFKSADTIVISSFLGLTILAVFQNYYYIMNSIYGIMGIVFSSVLAGIGNSLISESVEKNYVDLKKFTFIVCWVLCFCCCCFLCLYQPFMQLWVGIKYMLSYQYVILFVVYFYVCELAMVWATIKDAAGLWHSDRFRPLIGATANLIMNIILVNVIGLAGVLLSTILSYIFISMPWLLHNIFTLLYKRSCKEYLKKLSLYCLCTALSCVICAFLCSRFSLSPMLSLVVNAVICMVIPNAVQYIILRNTEEFSATLLLAKKIIRRRA